MSIKVTVLYPKTADSNFDMDYYLSTHMPLVSEKWQSYGLKGWEVIQFGPQGPDKKDPAFMVQATLIWDSPDDVGKAMAGPEAAQVLGDIPNFTNTQPTLIGGKIMKTHTH